jgi:hypothetical protein
METSAKEFELIRGSSPKKYLLNLSLGEAVPLKTSVCCAGIKYPQRPATHYLKSLPSSPRSCTRIPAMASYFLEMSSLYYKLDPAAK